ncbi:hypothetical protein GA0115233_104111 [Streptomyces sp. DI166]|uniref:hypothetical protein n=1 Tax=Streptomyces sp. DI166 TaxID=1839783 RepID=UPI0007F55AE7|nr:hypothetical protein [Streptomyces sp. DI166]SBT92174.1 hypothetical protein GA0115233_104111 [Streptomyces sp. DI166]
MIIRIGPRNLSAGEALAEALGRPVSDHEALTGHTVVAHWDNLDVYTPLDEGQSWTTAEFAEHLDDPNWRHPVPVSPHGDRRSIWHADVRLHPNDRELTRPEWTEIAHRIARAAGIQHPGDDHGCRWIAVQAQPGRLDLIANLIRPDDTWTAQPHRLFALLAAESRRIEAELGLLSPRTGPDPQQPDQQARFAGHRLEAGTADAASPFGVLLRQLAAERTGPLSTVRGLIEHAATASMTCRMRTAPTSRTSWRWWPAACTASKRVSSLWLRPFQHPLKRPLLVQHPVHPHGSSHLARPAPGSPADPTERTLPGLADRFLTLRRDVHSGEVLARGGDPEAHSILSPAASSPSSTSTRPITGCPSALAKPRSSVSPPAPSPACVP